MSKNYETWGGKPKAGKQNLGILDYTHGIRQQNSKELIGEYGLHKWYDPHSGRMGCAGENYPGTNRKGY